MGDKVKGRNLNLTFFACALLPIIFKSPDTGLAFGVLPQVVLRTSSSGNPSSIRMNNLKFAAGIGLRYQF